MVRGIGGAQLSDECFGWRLRLKIASSLFLRTVPKRRRLFGKLLFALPFLLLVAAIVYGYFSASQPGSLVVDARDAHTLNPLAVQAYVNGKSVTTPTTLSLVQGVYNVTFSQLEWYQTPGARTVSLSGGHTAYALGEYTPTPEIIRISSQGFDITSISAKSGLSPVVWVNTSAQFVVLLGDQFNRVIINPNQNFTYIYQSTGRFQYSIWQTDFTGTVGVV